MGKVNRKFPGLSQYRGPLCYELAGKTFRLVMDNGKVFSLDFPDEKRLRWCEEHPDRDLLLGVDRALLKKDGVLKERLEASEYFQLHGFLFRDFPGVDKVSKLLDSLV